MTNEAKPTLKRVKSKNGITRNLKAGDVYLISKDETDNPKLGAKLLANGTESLFLEYYLGYNKVYDNKKDAYVAKMIRRKEALKRYLIIKPRTPEETERNKSTLELAKKIRVEKSEQMKNMETGHRINLDTRKLNFLDYFQAYIDKYTKKDIRMLQIALQRFKDFLGNEETPEYNKFAKNIKPQQITKDMMIDFTDYLKSRSVGEGAKSIYQRFKKVVNYAIEHDVMLKNPCKGISIKVDENTLRKEILSEDEEQALINTHYDNENPEIRRAFIFCLYVGMRFCDVKTLTFGNIDYSNKLLKFEQNKTKGESSASGVTIPINDDILGLIGEPPDGCNRGETLVFRLPSYECCLKALGRWVKRAGITKHISWHCARHSFAVSILNNGANIKTVADLLGHSSLKHTGKYLHAVDELKRQAINSLPKLNLGNNRP
jgi:integrase/recombinase XerD